MAVVRGLIRTNRRTGSNWADLFMPVGPDTFRILGKIAKLEVFETETLPAEDVKVWKALV